MHVLHITPLLISFTCFVLMHMPIILLFIHLVCCVIHLTALPTRKITPWKLSYFLFILIPPPPGSQNFAWHINKHWIKVYRIRLNCITIKLNRIMYLPQISEFCVSDDVLGSGCHFPHARWHVASAISATVHVEPCANYILNVFLRCDWGT